MAASGDPDGTRAAVRGRARLLWPDGSTRASLMNAGADAAAGDVLRFLHADALPPGGLLALLRRALADPGVVGGAFTHRFAEPVWTLRAISALNRMRYRLTRNYYGDQGIFVRTTVFRALGGYRDLALMEDLDVSQRLKRAGRTVVIPEPLVTSGRRFLARGPWRTAGFGAWLLLLRTLRLDTQRYAERWRGREGGHGHEHDGLHADDRQRPVVRGGRFPLHRHRGGSLADVAVRTQRGARPRRGLQIGRAHV